MWSDEGVGFIEFMERFFRCEAAFAGAVSFADAVATGEDGLTYPATLVRLLIRQHGVSSRTLGWLSILRLLRRMHVGEVRQA